jgi:hypothetical protein
VHKKSKLKAMIENTYSACKILSLQVLFRLQLALLFLQKLIFPFLFFFSQGREKGRVIFPQNTKKLYSQFGFFILPRRDWKPLGFVVCWPCLPRKDIVFRVIIEFSSLRDFGPYVVSLFL